MLLTEHHTWLHVEPPVLLMISMFTLTSTASFICDPVSVAASNTEQPLKSVLSVLSLDFHFTMN